MDRLGIRETPRDDCPARVLGTDSVYGKADIAVIISPGMRCLGISRAFCFRGRTYGC